MAPKHVALALGQHTAPDAQDDTASGDAHEEKERLTHEAKGQQEQLTHAEKGQQHQNQHQAAAEAPSTQPLTAQQPGSTNSTEDAAACDGPLSSGAGDAVLPERYMLESRVHPSLVVQVCVWVWVYFISLDAHKYLKWPCVA